jgi:ABC-type glutathione transport system ATPase component
MPAMATRWPRQSPPRTFDTSSARSPSTASRTAALRRPERLQDAACRRPVAAADGGGYDLVIVDNSDQPVDPDRRHDGSRSRLIPRLRRPGRYAPGPASLTHPSSRSMSILALKNVSKSFGALKVTDDVSFEVPEGMALGIIGPNGAGKSTLFNLITGNLSADSGTDRGFEGRDVTRCPQCSGACRRRAVVPDPAALRQSDGLREPAGGRHIRARQKRARGRSHMRRSSLSAPN